MRLIQYTNETFTSYPRKCFAYLTPIPAMSLVSSAIPPGRSVTVTTNLTKRPSAARPRSITRPNAVVSMLPPHSGRTTLWKMIKAGEGE